jgi:hypothetical protein
MRKPEWLGHREPTGRHSRHARRGDLVPGVWGQPVQSGGVWKVWVPLGLFGLVTALGSLVHLADTRDTVASDLLFILLGIALVTTALVILFNGLAPSRQSRSTGDSSQRTMAQTSARNCRYFALRDRPASRQD